MVTSDRGPAGAEHYPAAQPLVATASQSTLVVLPILPLERSAVFDFVKDIV